MKQTGLILIVIGILISAFAGFNFITKKKVLQIGKLEITKDKNHILDWSPIAGVLVIVAGGAVYIYGTKKS